MSIEEKPPFKRVIVCTAVIVAMMIIVLIAHRLLYHYAGWPFDYEFFFERFAIITGGIVFPIILLILSIIGLSTYTKTASIPLIFGIIIAIISTILTIVAALWTGYDIVELVTDPHVGFNGLITAGTVVSLLMGIFCMIAGIQLIKYYFSTGA
jgi:hypothetical protein